MVLYVGTKLYGHDSAVFAVDPGTGAQFGISTERVTRFKHDDLLAIPALDCLASSGALEPESVERVVVASAFVTHEGEMRPVDEYERTLARRRLLEQRYLRPHLDALADFESLGPEQQAQLVESHAEPDAVRAALSKPTARAPAHEHFMRRVRARFPAAEVELRFYDHEFCHAASAYYTSGFDRALVIAVDGRGDGGSHSAAYLGSDGRVRPVARIESDKRFLDAGLEAHEFKVESSFGGIYGYFTYMLGFTPDADEGKVEALAAFAERDNVVYRELMACVARDGVALTLDEDRLERVLAADVFRAHVEALGRESMAAAVQGFTEDALIPWIRALSAQHGCATLCLCGGVFANVIVNLRLFEEVAERMFVVPAMADDGSAQGAAYAAMAADGVTMSAVASPRVPYLGTGYSRERIAADLCKFAGDLCVTDLGDAWPEEAARRIAAGQVGALFHGRMEWGPRALGNRSIVADPRRADIFDVLNLEIKRRPKFQPFCPAVLEEERGRLFPHSYSNPHMTCAFRLASEYREALPGAIHVDGTARAQFVRAEDNPMFHRMLVALRERTGFGVCINTSFNRHGRTIVETPQDALTDFRDTDLDFVVLEGFLVEKNPP